MSDLHAKGCQQAGSELENLSGVESSTEQLCCAAQEIKVRFCGGSRRLKGAVSSFPHICADVGSPLQDCLGNP